MGKGFVSPAIQPSHSAYGDALLQRDQHRKGLQKAPFSRSRRKREAGDGGAASVLTREGEVVNASPKLFSFAGISVELCRNNTFRYSGIE